MHICTEPRRELRCDTRGGAPATRIDGRLPVGFRWRGAVGASFLGAGAGAGEPLAGLAGAGCRVLSQLNL